MMPDNESPEDQSRRRAHERKHPKRENLLIRGIVDGSKRAVRKIDQKVNGPMRPKKEKQDLERLQA